jgi:hypothetical protein
LPAEPYSRELLVHPFQQLQQVLPPRAAQNCNGSSSNCFWPSLLHSERPFCMPWFNARCWEMTPGVVAETDRAGALKSEDAFFDGERVARRDGATGTGGFFYYFSYPQAAQALSQRLLD